MYQRKRVHLAIINKQTKKKNHALTSTSLYPWKRDYSGCSSVEVEEAENVNYVFSASKEDGFDTSINAKASLGLKNENQAGVGIATKITDVSSLVGVTSSIDFPTSNLNESSVSSGRNATKTSRLKVQGEWQPADGAINPNVGQRFVPANLGFALVQSDTMDKFAWRLKHNNALVSYSMRVNPKIPKDWNMISFKTNNKYTKQGNLDGSIGEKPYGGMQLDPDYA